MKICKTHGVLQEEQTIHTSKGSRVCLECTYTTAAKQHLPPNAPLELIQVKSYVMQLKRRIKKQREEDAINQA